MRRAVVLVVALACLSVAQLDYQNPLIPLQRPDPGAYRLANGTYYVANTSFNTSWAFPISMSNDLANWTLVGYVFPTVDSLPVWASMVFTWAPEIHLINDVYVVYYAAQDTTGLLCVGAAVSSGDILGPYVDIGVPLVRNESIGSIDPSMFFDQASQQYYLLWKDNPACCKTPLWIQPLAANGTALLGEKTFMITNDLDWEGGDVEGPWLIYQAPYYYLFYSANNYITTAYCVSVARSSALLGPYEKIGYPLMKTNAIWSGPGHCSVVPGLENPDEWVMIYHAWFKQNIGGDYNRMLLMDVIAWDDNAWPYFPANNGTPSVVPQPVP